jgi:CTP:molybdopterin cytidylyltransferase MocA
MPAPSVLVLASGRGERFRAAGGGIHKLHAPLGPRTVVVPSVEGRRGHPVGFAAACGAALMQLQGAASVIRAHAPFRLVLDDIGCVTDIDTPSDLEAAQHLLQNRP